MGLLCGVRTTKVYKKHQAPIFSSIFLHFCGQKVSPGVGSGSVESDRSEKKIGI